MATEIERKFLVRDTAFLRGLEGTRLRQGYLAHGERATLRVRLAGQHGVLTVKGRTRGIVRQEFEYSIPLEDARQMLDSLCVGPCIDKVRYRVPQAAHVWEVDVFEGANEGLVLAEIELASSEEAFERPDWLGEEVSNDARYFNANLATTPWRSWGESA